MLWEGYAPDISMPALTGKAQKIGLNFGPEPGRSGHVTSNFGFPDQSIPVTFSGHRRVAAPRNESPSLMQPLELKRRLRGGQRIYGTLIVSDSPRWPAVVSELGFDFVFIDTEHIAIDRAPLSWMCQAYRALGLPPLVRVTAPDPYEACTVLDGGAAGIIVPYVETADEARRMVGAVKYRPLKGLRLEAALRGEPLEPALQAYLDDRNGAHALVLNIESRPAVERLDEILSVPGIDGVLIGPHDLSCSLGIPEQYDHPEFERAVRTIFTRARSRGLGAGIHSWLGLERMAEWARSGANLLIHEADLTTFSKSGRRDVAQLRQALGEKASAGSGAEEAI